MSEILPPPFENTANIIETFPIIDTEGKVGRDVYFVIEEKSTGRDVTATLSFLEPDPTKFAYNIEYFLKEAIDVRGALRNKEVQLIIPNPIDTGTDQVEVIHSIKFGSNLTLDDVKTSFHAVYGERLPQQLIILLETIIDTGFLKGQVVRCTPNNEISSATRDKIFEEMDYLTRRFEAGEL